MFTYVLTQTDSKYSLINISKLMSQENHIERLTQALDESPKRNLQDKRDYQVEDYLEYSAGNLGRPKQALLRSLIALTAETPSKALENIIKHYNRHTCSLLAYTHQFSELHFNQPMLQLSHRSSHSQSVLLALVVAKNTDQEVDLVISNKGLAAAGHLISGDLHEDKVSYMQSTIQKEGVRVVRMDEWDSRPWKSDVKHAVVDIFDINPTQYTPFIAKNHQVIKEKQSVVFYHSHLQDQQFSKINEKLQFEAVPIQIWPDTPIETITCQDEPKMFELMASFLKEDARHAQKKDFIIFIPVQISLKRYQHRLEQYLNKLELTPHINIITGPRQKCLNIKNNFFLVRNTRELTKWNYNYQNAIYVLDYGEQNLFRFDYSKTCYATHHGPASSIERAKRMSQAVSNGFGVYISLQNQQNKHFDHYDEVFDLGSYVIRMVDYGLSQHLQLDNPSVKQCVSVLRQLNILGNSDHGLTITDAQVVQAVKQGVYPLQACLIYRVLRNQDIKPYVRAKIANLAAIAAVVMHNESYLKLNSNELGDVFRLHTNIVWKRSGYIQSCLEIFTRADSIQLKELEKISEAFAFNRASSRMSENEEDPFGGIYGLIEEYEEGPDVTDSTVGHLLHNVSASSQVFYNLREEVERYRDIFELERIPILLEQQDLNEVLKTILSVYNSAFLYYSGYKRTGYKSDSVGKQIHLHKQSLFSKLGERPELVIATQLKVTQGRVEVLRGNAMRVQTFMEIGGMAPARNSSAENECEIQVHGISSSIFEEMLKNDGKEIRRFQADNDCQIEPNQAIDLLLIHCAKARGEEVRASFDEFMGRTKERLAVANKMINYLKTTNLVMGAGGEIKEILKTDNYVHKCRLSNLHPEVTAEDLDELFEEFFKLKGLELSEVNKEGLREAILTFNSQKDFYRFNDYFNGCVLYQLPMVVEALKEEKAKLEEFENKQYIDFRWFAWRPEGRAYVRFAKEAEVEKAVNGFLDNPELDGAKVLLRPEGTSLFIQQLSDRTDEIYLRDALKGYGEVVEVEVLKIPLKDAKADEIYLNKLIFNSLTDKEDDRYSLEEIVKGENGLRSCRAHFTAEDDKDINEVVNTLHQSFDNLGETRLYASSVFVKYLYLPEGLRHVEGDLIEEATKECLAQDVRVIDNGPNSRYLRIRASAKATCDMIWTKMGQKLQGTEITLSKAEVPILFNEVGIANILDLEEKYNAKFVVDLQAKKLRVIGAQEKINLLKSEVHMRLSNSFFYRVSLGKKIYKHLKRDEAVLLQMQNKYSLASCKVEYDNMSLLLEGKAAAIEKAINYFMHLAESLTTGEEEQLNSDLCNVCCEQISQPFRLQACGHRFCRKCVNEYMLMVLKDAAMFPLKCPHCQALVLLKDIENILGDRNANKLNTLAINKYVGEHSKEMAFCYTPGCKQINIKHGPVWRCDTCKNNYCNACREPYHPGETCEQAMNNKQSDNYFMRYMRENGVRRCPNENCRMPVYRVDGCYRVTCTRCNTSMCFKCEPDQMEAFSDYNKCYQHLSKVHGGYF